jgi:tRNA threonylcarbamoyladenosine biosynthesis protein TsaB
MTLLAIDTTGANCSVALRIAGRPDVIVSEMIGRGHAERLAPMVAEALAGAGVAACELTRIGVTTGPGSFAGTRVATAFARGLALATGAQAVGIGNLAVFAHQARAVRPLAVLHDAKRGEVILQIWTQAGANEPERLAVADVPGRIRALAGEGVHLAGPGTGVIGAAGFAVTGDDVLDLAALLDLVAAAEPAAAPPSPFYARPPDAKLPGGVEPV